MAGTSVRGRRHRLAQERTATGRPVIEPGIRLLQEGRQLSPRVDRELAIGVAEVHLHRLDGDEERLRDLGVGRADPQNGDPPLARRQRPSLTPRGAGPSRRSHAAPRAPLGSRDSRRHASSSASRNGSRARSLAWRRSAAPARPATGRAAARGERRRCSTASCSAARPRHRGDQPWTVSACADVAGVSHTRAQSSAASALSAAACASPVACSSRAIRSHRRSRDRAPVLSPGRELVGSASWGRPGPSGASTAWRAAAPSRHRAPRPRRGSPRPLRARRARSGPRPGRPSTTPASTFPAAARHGRHGRPPRRRRPILRAGRPTHATRTPWRIRGRSRGAAPRRRRWPPSGARGRAGRS